MRTRHLVDPELLGLAEAFPTTTMCDESLPRARLMVQQLIAEVDCASFGVEKRELIVPQEGDAPSVRCLLYQPFGGPRNDAAYLQIHGGGFIMGSVEDGEARNVKLASELGITVLSVSYRLAPENPYPAGLMDCYRALVWLAENASDVGVSPDRIAVGGDSAGGGMAAQLCLYARDHGGPRIVFQNLIYPVLDDRTGALGSAVDPMLGEIMWTPESNRYMWAALIGPNDPADVAPARAASLKGLPPALITIGALDLFLDEDIAYARRLLRDQVACSLIVYPGAFHAFDLAGESKVAQRFEHDILNGLKTGLGL